MKQLNPYLAFGGKCEEAMKFYKDAFGGELHMQTFGESPQEVPDDYKQKIMHAELKTDGIHLMASDTMPGHVVNNGDNITLSIGMTDLDEQAKLFHKLSAGGRVTMPLQDTFWGARFGMLIDKFGIHWMLNCALPDQQ